MDDCIFCRIVEGEIPCQKLAESENLMVFLDAGPVADGHALVIPKKHTTNLLTMPEYLGNELLEVTQRAAQAILKATGAEGFNFILNNGPAAGQVVFHAHFHIVPRKEGDGIIEWQHGHEATAEELAAVREKIISAINEQ